MNEFSSNRKKMRQTVRAICHCALAVFAVWEIVSVVFTAFNGYVALEGKFWEHKKRMFLLFPVYCLLFLAALLKLTALVQEWAKTEQTPRTERSKVFVLMQGVAAITLLVSVIAWAFTDGALCKQLAYLSFTAFTLGYLLSCLKAVKPLRLRLSPVVGYVVFAVGMLALMLTISNAFNTFQSVKLVSESIYYTYAVSKEAFIGCLIPCGVFTGCTAVGLLCSPFERTGT
ncbi:MAG: hypothetical protein IJW60_04450 [Clostridia bacterium]|nr:hypothetical protein [Clostridia bacterium]